VILFYNALFHEFYLYKRVHFQGSPQISSRDIGYVLRILGQNPTEDEIVEMVMKVINFFFLSSNSVWCVIMILLMMPMLMTIVMTMKIILMMMILMMMTADVQANCEWDGVMTRSDFLAAGIDILK